MDVPKEGSNGMVRIEGPTEGVLKAKTEIMNMVDKLQDEVTITLDIEQRLHKTVIGKSGEHVKEVFIYFSSSFCLCLHMVPYFTRLHRCIYAAFCCIVRS